MRKNRKIDRTIVVRDIEIEGRQFAMEIVTLHPGGRCRTLIHDASRGNTIGGVRAIRAGPADTRLEAAHLAAAMTPKNQLAGLLANGQKSIAEFDGGVPAAAARAELIGAHARAVLEVFPGAVFGPDLGTTEEVQDLLIEQEGLRYAITGTSRRHGGVEIDSVGATAHGLAVAFDVATADGAIRPTTAVVQGLGAVGAHAAQQLARRGVRVVAANNEQGSLFDPMGLDVEALLRLWKEHGDAGLSTYSARHPGARYSRVRDEVFDARADVLVLAARTSVFAAGREVRGVVADENSDCRAIEGYLESSGVRVILEGANRPLTPAAEAAAEARGTVVLPDVVANCGGLVGCYLEWAYRDVEGVSRAALVQRTADHTRRVVTDNVRALTTLRGTVRERVDALAALRCAQLDQPRARARAWLAAAESSAA